MQTFSLLNFTSGMTDELLIKRCLELAQKAKGFTAPNPMVGAVLVHNGRIISEGWHRQYGGPHAEVDCLERVLDGDKHLIPECTMYVNLEPCAHQGKTPACALRLVKEAVKSVVICNRDPFALVSGKGIEILNEAGIVTQTGISEKAGLWVNRRFFCFHTQSRPYIILKWAETRDGYIAPADSSRFQITNNGSQQLVHKWRTEEAAIMVGTTTAINDNPSLTARLWEGKQPLRLVLDRNMMVPRFHHVMNIDAPTWIVNEEYDLPGKGLSYVQLNFGAGMLQQLMGKLHEHNILSVIVEGGAQLLNSFIAAGLWDEARIFTGAVDLGGGVAAPGLTDATHAFSTTLAEDNLQVFVRRGSAYQYVEGMEL